MRGQISVIRNSHLPFITQSRKDCLVNSAFVRVRTCPATTHAHKMCRNALLSSLQAAGRLCCGARSRGTATRRGSGGEFYEGATILSLPSFDHSLSRTPCLPLLFVKTAVKQPPPPASPLAIQNGHSVVRTYPLHGRQRSSLLTFVCMCVSLLAIW